MNDNGRQHVYIRYTEVWPNGMRDALFARLKSNGKFHCDSDAGYVQKARLESTMPVNMRERLATEGVKKYYARDDEATHESTLDGLPKKVLDDGDEDINNQLWDLYGAWPTTSAPVRVSTKLTWPLPFSQVHALLMGVGWSAEDIEAMETALFHEEDSGRRDGCGAEQVTWPDIQHVMRKAVCKSGRGDEWTQELEAAYSALTQKIRLSLKIERHKLAGLMKGSWRMYCKPLDDDEFSYGFIVGSVDDKNLTFTAHSRAEGRYKIEDGRLEYNNSNGRQHVYIQYTEVWPNGLRDKLFARLKWNGKFHCDSDAGYVQKARHLITMPKSVEQKMGVEGVKKYYALDDDALAD